MRYHGLIIICLVLFSCAKKAEKQAQGHEIKVVEAIPYNVPADNIEPPTVYNISDARIQPFPMGKPTVVNLISNVRRAGSPHAVKAGIPTVRIPGRDSCAFPTVVAAVDSSFLAGQPDVVEAGKMARKEINSASVSSLGKEEGLIQDVIYCLLEDKVGNLWFGTNKGGVTKYDGRYFTHYTTNQGLVSNDVLCMLQDRRGTIWFGTERGVSKFDGKNFTNYGSHNGLSGDAIQCMTEDRKGNIWFGTYGNGATSYDGHSFTRFSTKEGLGEESIYAIYEDRIGNLWFGTWGGGVTRFDGDSFSTFTSREGLGSDNVLSIQQDAGGKIWFGTIGGGVTCFDGEFFNTYTTEHGLIDNTIGIIALDHLDKLWFATQGGACCFDGVNFTSYTTEQGLTDNSVYALLEDQSGNVWVGTGGGGVCRIDGVSFNHLSTREGLSNSSVECILEESESTRWLGTYDGLVRITGNSIENFRNSDDSKRLWVQCIHKDASGKVWFGIDKQGLVWFDGANFNEWQINEQLSAISVSSIIEQRSGSLMFGTYGNGILLYDGNELIQYTSRNGLCNDQVTSLCEDDNGNTWIGTEGGGVSKFSGTVFQNFNSINGLASDNVHSIKKDNLGNIWLGTDKGLCRYDGKSFAYFTTQEGLSNDAVLSLWQDSNSAGSDLWIGTRMGLCKTSPEIIEKKLRSSKTPRLLDDEALFKTFDVKDGFFGVGCNRGAMQRMSDGKLWVGANDILTTCDTRRFYRDTIAPTIALTGLDLFNEKVSWAAAFKHRDSTFELINGVRINTLEIDSLSLWYNVPQGLSLPHDNNNLTFRFLGITMHQPAKVKYHYKLVGFDENWSAITSLNTAPYGNLDAGTYTFMVKAMNSEGIWSEPLSYTFTIRAPWWNTWWSYIIYLVLFILAVRSFIRWRFSFLKARQKELEQKVERATVVIRNQKNEVERQKDAAEEQRKMAEQQRLLVQEKNREMLDSIEYAKRIQTAILPPPRVVKSYLQDSFILYLPKDIVAGDFYWLETIEDQVYLAACDCTGHGVPGAMVSVVCNNALSRAVNEFALRKPGDIFDKTRELVVENFAKSDDDVKDGMDASLCVLDVTNRKLRWAGANNPLWIYREATKTMEEIKPNKQPIGKGYDFEPFTSHEMTLKKGDIVYLFTDGYADQFGGEKNKKLTRAKFRELLVNIAQLSMDEQRERLLSNHNQYRGNQEQVDDICVIGVRVQ